MIAKWYLGALLAVLTVFGLTSEGNNLPNQEIVVQFDQQEVTIDQAEDALAKVRTQLESIGVKELQIQSLRDGSLKISYYSELDPSAIAQLFDSEDNLTEGGITYHQEGIPSNGSSQENLLSYQLNVFEIQHQPDVDPGMNGTQLEIAYAKDIYFQPKINPQSTKSLCRSCDETQRLVLALHRYNEGFLKDTFRHIPEVRAGPFFPGIL